MIALLLLQYSPAPPPPPVEIVAPVAYAATCTVRAENAGEAFPVSLSVGGKGKSRKAVIRSGRPDIAPSGRGVTSGVTRHERNRHSEYVSVGNGPRKLTMYHNWYGAEATTSTIEFVRIAVGETIVIRAKGTCTLVRKQT